MFRPHEKLGNKYFTYCLFGRGRKKLKNKRDPVPCEKVNQGQYVVLKRSFGRLSVQWICFEIRELSGCHEANRDLNSRPVKVDSDLGQGHKSLQNGTKSKKKKKRNSPEFLPQTPFQLITKTHALYSIFVKLYFEASDTTCHVDHFVQTVLHDGRENVQNVFPVQKNLIVI